MTSSSEGKVINQDLENRFNQLQLIIDVTALCYSTFNIQIP